MQSSPPAATREVASLSWSPVPIAYLYFGFCHPLLPSQISNSWTVISSFHLPLPPLPSLPSFIIFKSLFTYPSHSQTKPPLSIPGHYLLPKGLLFPSFRENYLSLPFTHTFSPTNLPSLFTTETCLATDIYENYVTKYRCVFVNPCGACPLRTVVTTSFSSLPFSWLLPLP